MYCPFCGAQETRVVDSRLGQEASQVRRRRECVECKERFTTYETAELNLPRVIKSDKRRDSFKEDKLRAGIMRALEKRPVESESIEAVVHRIKKQLLAGGEREILSRKIGEMVMDELISLDHVAYVRFASVYRSFKDVSEFKAVIDRLENKPLSLPE